MTNLFLMIVVIITQQGIVDVSQDERNYTSLQNCEAAGAQLVKELTPRTRYVVTGCVALPTNLINAL